MKDEQEARAWRRAQPSLSVNHPSGKKPGHSSGQGECGLSELETQDNTPSLELGFLMGGEKKRVGKKESTDPKLSQVASAQGLGAESLLPQAIQHSMNTFQHIHILHTRDAHGSRSHIPSLSAFPGRRK